MIKAAEKEEPLGILYGPIGTVNEGEDGMLELHIDQNMISHLSEVEQKRVLQIIQSINEGIREKMHFVDMSEHLSGGNLLRPIDGITDKDLDQLESVVLSQSDGRMLMFHVPQFITNGLNEIHGE